MAEQIKGDVRILYKGNSVENIHLLILRLANTGNRPIVANDFVRPVTFDLGQNTRILTAEISERTPTNLETAITVDGSKLVLTPALFNQRDSVTVKALASQFGENIAVDARIVGIGEIKRIHEDADRTTRYRFFLFTLVTLSIMWGINLLLYAAKLESTDYHYVILVALVLLVVLAYATIYLRDALSHLPALLRKRLQ